MHPRVPNAPGGKSRNRPLAHQAHGAIAQPQPANAREKAILEVRGLRVYFDTEAAVVRAVDGVDLAVRRGECLALVGESGCGKTLTALAILRLVPCPPGRIAGGQVVFEGRDLLALPEPEMRRVRGAGIAMVFQEPMTSLNPALPVGFQVAEAVRAHCGASRAEAADRAVGLLRQMRIPDPAERARDYPHQLSGGMRQRVMLAMALACSPRLLIADEPTTALDVTVQAQMMELLAAIRAERDLALLLVTHDLGLVAQMADAVAVMYAGRIVERAPAAAIFASPRHPYTRGLLRCVPALGERRERLPVIPGSVPDPAARPDGCAFRPRCDRASAQCATEVPPMQEDGHGRGCACWNPHEDTP